MLDQANQAKTCSYELGESRNVSTYRSYTKKERLCVGSPSNLLIIAFWFRSMIAAAAPNIKFSKDVSWHDSDANYSTMGCLTTSIVTTVTKVTQSLGLCVDVRRRSDFLTQSCFLSLEYQVFKNSNLWEERFWMWFVQNQKRHAPKSAKINDEKLIYRTRLLKISGSTSPLLKKAIIWIP